MDVKTTLIPDDQEGTITVKSVYDAEPVLESNRIERNEFRNYKSREIAGGLVKVATLHPGDIERLRNMGYNIMSHDRDEFKRALLFLQSEQKNLLTVEGKPFSKKTNSWR